jgi:hypothetical protein
MLDMRRWEETYSEHMANIWLTDWDSLCEHLISNGSEQVDNKRLAIDLAALRQLVGERGGECTDVIDSSSGDYPRWIDQGDGSRPCHQDGDDWTLRHDAHRRKPCHQGQEPRL